MRSFDWSHKRRPESFLRHLVLFFAVLDGGLSITINSITAEDDRVIIEVKGKSKSKAGLDYNNDYCIVVIVANGRIQHVREYLDTELVTSVFGRG